MDDTINVNNIIQNYFMEFEEEFSELQLTDLMEEIAKKVGINIYFYNGISVANNLDGNFNIFINNKKDEKEALENFVYYLGKILIYKETLNKKVQLPPAELRELALDFFQQFNSLLNNNI